MFETVSELVTHVRTLISSGYAGDRSSMYSSSHKTKQTSSKQVNYFFIFGEGEYSKYRLMTFESDLWAQRLLFDRISWRCCPCSVERRRDGQKLLTSHPMESIWKFSLNYYALSVYGSNNFWVFMLVLRLYLVFVIFTTRWPHSEHKYGMSQNCFKDR